jgi:tRNA threonylcarbamoyladenosine biosynthesis protein TsaE
MDTFTSHDPAETRRLGGEAIRRTGPGWVFGLTGDLGAGKTQFVQGAAAALGIRGRVQSPTFALVHEHRQGTFPLYHLDLYRLETTDQILAAGLGEYLNPTDGISIIEWYERWQGPPPPRLCRVTFTQTGEHSRLLTLIHDPACA